VTGHSQSQIHALLEGGEKKREGMSLTAQSDLEWGRELRKKKKGAK